MRPACNVDGCRQYSIARGWCQKHYKAWKRYGNPLGARTPGDITDPNDPRHGTVNGYGNQGCRCPRCCKAHTDYMWRHRISQGRGFVIPRSLDADQAAFIVAEVQRRVRE